MNQSLSVVAGSLATVGEYAMQSQAKQEDQIVKQNAVLAEMRASLNESQQRLRTLFDYAPEALVLLDVETGHFIDANPAAEKLFGLSRREMTDKGPLDMSPPRQPDGCLSRDRAKEMIQEAVGGGTPTFEWWHCHANEEQFPCEVRLVRMPWGNRNVIRGSITEVSKRKQAEMHERGRTRILEQIARGESLSNVLLGLVQTIEEMLPSTTCSVLIYDQKNGCLRCGAAPNLPAFYNEAIDGLQIGPSVGSCGTAAYTATRIVVPDVMNHPYWANFLDIARQAGIRACWSEPVISLDGAVLGTFAIYYREVREPTATELRVIETASQLAGIGIAHHQAKDELIQVNESLERRVAERTASLQSEGDLLRRLISVQESDRQIVAQDIHDGFVQDVVGALMYLESIHEGLTPDSRENKLDQARELLRAAMLEARRMINDLRPMVLEDEGVIEAIKHLVEDHLRSEFAVAFHHDVQFDRLDCKLEGAIFRIVQESLNNVRHHAKTNHAAVQVVEEHDELRIVVRDHGEGFDREQIGKDRFGLRGIEERARLFGGESSIESKLGVGTTVHVRLPIKFQDSGSFR